MNQTTPPSRPLRLGFVGGALNSAVGYAHFVSCTMDKRFTVVTGCFSRDPGMNTESGLAYGVAPERIHLDWQTLLQRESGLIEAVVVLTPTPAHTPIITAALEAGIPVICEKALAGSAAEGRNIQASVDRHSGFLAVTYNYTGYPMVRELRQMIQAGKLGEVQQIHVEMPQEGFLRTTNGALPQPQAWRLHDGPIPTVSLDLGVHAHHLVEFLCDTQALEVVSDQRSLGNFPGIVDDVTCIARYSGNVRVNYWYGKTALGYRNGLRLRVFGSTASAEWVQSEHEELSLHGADGRRERIDRGSSQLLVAHMRRYNRFKAGHPAGFIEAFANLYADIADQLLRPPSSRGSEYVFDAWAATRGLEFLESVERSARSGSWQRISSLHAQGDETHGNPC